MLCGKISDQKITNVMRCVNCEFYNRADAPYCLDCGETDFTDSSLPAKGKDDFSQMVSLKFVFISTAIIGLIVTFMTLTQDLGDLYQNLFFAVTFGFMISLLISMTVTSLKNFIFRRDKRRREIASISKVTLNSISGELIYNIHLLTQENSELINLFSPVEEDEKGEIEYVETNETDKRLFENVEVQLALCQMQLNEIELIRLEGELLYYRENLNELINAETVEDEETIEELLQEFEYLEENTVFNEDNHYLDLFLSKEEIFLKKVETARKLCEKARDELIEKQKSPHLENEFTQHRTDLAADNQEFADFHIKNILDDYSKEFNELESESVRLKSAKSSSSKLSF